jgi:acyl-coenzyme A thioesterase 13
MAMIRGTMTSQDGKTIYCTCEHHKVSIPTPPDHLTYKVPWDDLWAADGAVVASKAKL